MREKLPCFAKNGVQYKKIGLSARLKILLIICLFAIQGSVSAQVSTYLFAQSTGTYTPVASPATVHGTTWDDTAGVSTTIPFNYTFNGTSSNIVYVSTNGYVTFGSSGAAAQYNPISASPGSVGAISAYGRDLINNGAAIVSGVEGSSPNRVFVIQWNNARRYSGTSAVTGDVLNFQIRLYETSNKAEIRYGTCTATSTTALTGQVGLRGTTNTDFNNRSSATSWAATTAGGANSATVTTSNTIMPSSGLTFTWTPVPAYCSAGATILTDEKISNVVFNTINNNSSATAGYENFTTVSTSVSQGSSYTFTATLSGAYSGDQTLVWIDYNGDKDFDDAGEQVYSSVISAGPHTTSITIPLTATLGATRMRVRLIDSANGAVLTPCGNSTYGQVEDYAINITASVPCSGTPNAGVATLLTPSSTCTGQTVSMSASSLSTGTGLTYLWQSSPNGSSWTNITGANTSAYSTTATAGNTYYRISSTCSGVTSYSNAINYTGTACGSILVPATGSSVIPCGTTTNLYDSGGSSGNYGFNQSGYTVLQNSGSRVISITGTVDVEATYDHVIIYAGTGTGGTILADFSGTGTISTITSAPGQELTVQLTSDNLVNQGGFAFTINSTGTCAPPTITSFSPGSVCPGGTVTLTGSVFTGATAVKINGLNATTFNVVSDTSITAVVPSNATTGSITVTGPGGVGTSATNLTINTLPGITSATAATNPICLSATTLLTANGVSGTGAVVTWYSAANGGGTNYGTGTTITKGPGTYYARVTGTCGSPVETSITVGAKTNVAIASATAAQSSICENGSTSITANGVTGNGAVVNWYTGSGASGSNVGSGTTINVGPGTYYAYVTGECGTPAQASVTVTGLANVTYYADADGDGFGDNAAPSVSCTGAPIISGHAAVLNNSDCNDAQLQYVDADGDGFGSTTLAACGVTNNSDCNDAQLQYVDADGDGFGSTTLAACGVTNNSDCNDAQLQYVDADSDGFGSTTLAACGVTNNSDCNDAQLQYVDADGDGFGSTTLAACGVTNNSDCNDAQLQYVDADGDGFGSTTLAACGVTNNSDCNDAQLQYVDADSDGFGSTTLAACGVTNNSDCNDAQLQYVDADSDGFGSTTLAACGVTNNSDCNDAQLQYVDADGDGFGSTTLAACGVTNNSDCNDAQLQYVDADGDGFGSTTLAACGVTNNSDCNDAQLQYVDADGDGFGSTTFAACGVTNNSDCNDAVVYYQDLDNDGFGSNIKVACGGVTNNTDCDDNTVRYADADGDGYGTLVKVACGGSTNSTDCDDTKASVHPGAAEVGYNLIDDDCDGLIDEGFPPKTTTITGNQCNTLLPTIDTQLIADIVAGAQGYQWRVTTLSGPSAGQVQTLNTLLRVMKLTQLANYAYATNYKIEVAVYYAGFLQPYTTSNCTVSTPAITTSLVNCNQTLSSMSDVIYATNVMYATGYRFRVSDGVNTAILDRAVREFRMNNITNFLPQFNKQYTVEIAVRNTNGQYLAYGAPCTVTTPIFPTTSVQDSQCDDFAPATASTYIYATSYPGAIAYVFNLTGPALPAQGIEITRTTRAFKLSDFSGLIAGATYNVRVRLVFNYNDIPGPYGKICTVIVPGALRMMAQPFNAVAYPNPFAESFGINVTTSATDKVTIKVYDMTGRLLEQSNIDAADAKSFTTGDRFPSGVYNVIVSQGDQVKTLRVVKR